MALNFGRTAIIALSLFAGTAHAQEHTQGPAITGTWRLQSVVRTDENGQTHLDWGKHPSGYITYGKDGRVMVLMLKDNRSAPHDVQPSDAEAISLYRSMLSYAGTYTVEGNKVVHHIDAAWNQIWHSTDLTRFFEVKGNHLVLHTAPGRNAIAGATGSSVLVWEKVE